MNNKKKVSSILTGVSGEYFAAAKEFYGVTNVEYGLQKKRVNETRIFIAPSTSGAANGFWDINYWIRLTRIINS